MQTEQAINIGNPHIVTPGKALQTTLIIDGSNPPGPGCRTIDLLSCPKKQKSTGWFSGCIILRRRRFKISNTQLKYMNENMAWFKTKEV